MSAKVPLNYYAEIIMGQSPKGNTCNTYGQGVPLLNGPTEFGSYYPTPTQYTIDPKRKSEVNDVLFCVRGSTTGRMNYSDQIYAIGRGIAAIRGKNGYPTIFVKSLIEHNMESLLKIATGSTFPNISKNMLNSFEVDKVCLSNAKKIAHILSTLDDKIELNRQMNRTLEAMAQALFKSWFVNFDPVHAKMQAKTEADLDTAAQELGISRDILDLFPDRLVESEMGMVPEGWEVKSLGSLCSVITKGTTPRKSDVEQAIDEKSIPFIKVKDITEEGEINRRTLEYIAVSIHEGVLKRSILETDDLLFSIAGTIGRVSIIDKDLNNANTNQAVGIIRLSDKKKYLYFVWLALKSKTIQRNILSKVVQGVQANTSLKNLKDIQILLPSLEVLILWNNMVGSIMEKIRENQAQIRKLERIRDTLLPKLLSGELDVSEAIDD